MVAAGLFVSQEPAPVFDQQDKSCYRGADQKDICPPKFIKEGNYQ
jgi:hypothetical protein